MGEVLIFIIKEKKVAYVIFFLLLARKNGRTIIEYEMNLNGKRKRKKMSEER